VLSGFHIFNASAGSGKTYQLTKSYLSLILSNVITQRFREILALTFTNKAVAEMKVRILDSLWVFGNPEISKEDSPMFHELAKELGLTVEKLQKKSLLALKLLLHNYDFFDVSTIDKFTHRVIKTFAKDLKVSQNFEVELDDDILLDEAIGKLLQKASENSELQQVLIDFSLQKVDADKSWNILYDLKAIGKLLFRENHYAHLKELSDKNIKDFDELKRFLKNKTSSITQSINQNAGIALNLIKENGLEHSDFKGQYFPKFMLVLQSGNHRVDFKASWKQNFDELPLYNKTCPENSKIILDGLHPQFSELFKNIREAVHALSFFENTYTNVLPLTVLNEIAKEVSLIQQEKQILHISEFNKLISREIANQPVPYIYERLGERYRHYFIDEFQDTSTMQWNNLIPLIGNALETENLNGEKGSLMLVGDAKQSIYRWRGGDPKQFLDLNDTAENPFTVSPLVNNLSTNWRSFDTVIEFNNDFFAHTANYLKEVDYQNLYLEQCQQETNQRKGGYVELVFMPEEVEDINRFYCEQVLETIGRILDKGFSYKDVCILVRKNTYGVLLADYLARKDVPIISSEALLLGNNPEVQFLVSLLRFLDNPSEELLHFELLEYLFKEDENRHDLIVARLGNMPEFLRSQYDYNIEQESGLPVLDVLERAISSFHLSPKSGAHVIHFLDVALEISEKSGVGIYGFLKHWDLKKDVLAISAPKNRDAVQLMTVHKSKGLEFPFVIFPFADSKINDRTKSKKLWVPLKSEGNLGFNHVLVSASKELEHYSEASNDVYTSENHLSELDDINVLYVAMTRAVKGLFVFTKESKGDTYGKLFQKYLMEKGLWNSITSRFEFGQLLQSEVKPSIETETKPIPYIYTHSSTGPKLAIVSESLWQTEALESRQWGTMVHAILAEINSQEDIDIAIERKQRKGHLSEEDIKEIEVILNAIVTHPKLSEFYGEEAQGMNEIEILDEEGESFRPDRLVFKENHVTLIDYKTGSQRPEHKSQLKKYSTLLKELDSNLVVAEKILVYIGDKIEPVFI
jgi:ATP-dependent exoDNAse (exonuclease V) beta subunit